MSYDQWKTASPYDGGNDSHCSCGVCIEQLNPDDEWVDEGYCSVECWELGKQNKELPCIRPMYELLSHDLGDNVDGWSKAIFKRTVCGAWLKLADHETIEIGSIVEGLDAECTTHTLKWPFTIVDLWNTVQSIEDEDEALANEASDDDVSDPQYEIEKIGAIRKGCDGADEYLLFTRTDDDIDLRELKDYAKKKYYAKCRGTGQYFCNSVSAVMVEHSTNRAIVTVHHRYDV